MKNPPIIPKNRGISKHIFICGYICNASGEFPLISAVLAASSKIRVKTNSPYKASLT